MFQNFLFCRCTRTADSWEVIYITSIMFLNIDCSLLLAETPTAGSLVVPVPRGGALELPAPVEVFLVGIPLEGSPCFFWSIEDKISFPRHPYAVPRVEGSERSPPLAPHTGGRHEYNAVLPGAPRGPLMALVNSIPVPRIPWNDASHFG
jgi:hypothetical protein